MSPTPSPIPKFETQNSMGKVFKDVAQPEKKALVQGPLNKGIETILCEEIVKGSLTTPSQVTFSQDSSGAYMAQLEGFSSPINLTELLTKVNFNQIKIPNEYLDLYAKKDIHISDLPKDKIDNFRKSKISDNKSPDKKGGNQQDDIELGELMAIRNYSDDTVFKQMNDLLRGIPNSPNYNLTNIADVLAHSVIASQGLNKLPDIQLSHNPEPLYLKRVEGDFNKDRFIKAAASGEVVELKGLVSSSYDTRGIAKGTFSDDVQIVFKNVVGKDISALSEFVNEKEYLIPPSTIRITGHKEVMDGGKVKHIFTAEGAHSVPEIELAGENREVEVRMTQANPKDPNVQGRDPRIRIDFKNMMERDLFVKQMIDDGKKLGVDLKDVIDVHLAQSAIYINNSKNTPNKLGAEVDSAGKVRINWGHADIAGIFEQRLQLNSHATVKGNMMDINPSSLQAGKAKGFQSTFYHHAKSNFEAVKKLEAVVEVFLPPTNAKYPNQNIGIVFQSANDREDFIKETIAEAKALGSDISKLYKKDPSNSNILYMKNSKDIVGGPSGVGINKNSKGKMEIDCENQGVARMLEYRLNIAGHANIIDSTHGVKIEIKQTSLDPANTNLKIYNKNNPVGAELAKAKELLAGAGAAAVGGGAGGGSPGSLGAHGAVLAGAGAAHVGGGGKIAAPVIAAASTADVEAMLYCPKTLPGQHQRLGIEFKNSADRDAYIKQMVAEGKKHGVTNIEEMFVKHNTNNNIVYIKNEKEITSKPKIGVFIGSPDNTINVQYGSPALAKAAQSQLNLTTHSNLSKSGTSINIKKSSLALNSALDTTFKKNVPAKGMGVKPPPTSMSF